MEAGPVSSPDEHFRRLERLYLGAPVNALYRPSIRIEEGHAEVSIDVRPDLLHAASAVHGAVYFKLLDDACFFAVNSLVRDVFVLTASFNLYLLRPVTEGGMRGVGRVVHSTRRLFVAEGEVLGPQEEIVAPGQRDVHAQRDRAQRGRRLPVSDR